MSIRRRLGWRYQKAGRRIWRKICSLLYYDRYPSLQRTILVAGTARSGTTWLGEIVASQTSGRIVFEPFNTNLIKDYGSFNYHQYMRPEENDEALEDYCRRVFSGKIRHRWLDREVDRLFPQYRVAKAVRANLFLEWIRRRFPQVSRVLIIRHPCAVVLSWHRLGWTADQDIAALLKQPKLIIDFLGDKLEHFYQAGTDEEKIGLLWCVSNLVPLKQDSERELHIVFYEHLVTRPEIEIPRLFAALDLPYSDATFARVIQPSMTASEDSAILNENNIVAHWRNALSARKIERILTIVETFGLDQIYGDGPLPLREYWGQFAE